MTVTSRDCVLPPPPDPDSLAELRQLVSDFKSSANAVKVADDRASHAALLERVCGLEERLEALEKRVGGSYSSPTYPSK